MIIDGRTNGPGIAWPGGKRVAVMLTFDFDAEYLRISRAKAKGTQIGFTDFSRGQYGPHEGLARCLDMLDTFGVKGTFFVPGIVAETYEDCVRGIHARGHELACHGYMHESERGVPRETEAARLDKCETLLKAITGKRPVGHRGPESIIHPFTPELLAEKGYLYSSSMKDCDWAYLWETEDCGADKLPLVELPCDITMDDFTYYYFTFSDPAVRSMYPDQEVIGNWKAEFDGLAEEGDKIFVLKLHPQLIGRASRIAALGAFIGYMQRHGAWIATCEEVARYVLEQSAQATDGRTDGSSRSSMTSDGLRAAAGMTSDDLRAAAGMTSDDLRAAAGMASKSTNACAPAAAVPDDRWGSACDTSSPYDQAQILCSTDRAADLFPASQTAQPCPASQMTVIRSTHRMTDIRPVLPGGRRIAVMLAFDLDAETMWTTRGDGNADHITNLSRGAYGPKQGVPRILKMLDTWGVKATFFIPGVIAERYPDVVREISRRGHEIGFHGYAHEEFTTTTYEEEDATMHRAEGIIRDICGQALLGHRAPGGVIHDYSLRLFLEHGYIYSSNWRDSDGPFIHRIDGKEVPLVELPKDSIFDDTAYDFYTDSAPERYGLKSPGEMYTIWKEEFDALAAEGRMINFVLHPQFIGRPSRVDMLSHLIGYMLAHGAWLETNYGVASYILAQRGLRP